MAHVHVQVPILGHVSFLISLKKYNYTNSMAVLRFIGSEIFSYHCPYISSGNRGLRPFLAATEGFKLQSDGTGQNFRGLRAAFTPFVLVP